MLFFIFFKKLITAYAISILATFPEHVVMPFSADENISVTCDCRHIWSKPNSIGVFRESNLLPQLQQRYRGGLETLSHGKLLTPGGTWANGQEQYTCWHCQSSPLYIYSLTSFLDDISETFTFFFIPSNDLLTWSVLHVLIKYEMKSDGLDLNHQKKDENFFDYLHSAWSNELVNLDFEKKRKKKSE